MLPVPHQMEALEGELAEQLAREAEAQRQRRAAAGAQEGSGGGGKPGKAAGLVEGEDGDDEEEEEQEKEEEEEEGEPGARSDQAIVARQAGLGGVAEGTRTSAGRCAWPWGHLSSSRSTHFSVPAGWGCGFEYGVCEPRYTCWEQQARP